MTETIPNHILRKIAVLDLFPKVIMNSVLSDHVFCKSNGLITEGTVKFRDGTDSFQRSALFDAIRKAYSDEENIVTIIGKNGKKWILSVEEKNNIKCIRMKNSEHTYISNEFWPLNSDISERLNNFEEIAITCNFSSITKVHWRNILSEKLVADDDINDLIREIAESPSSIFNKLKIEMLSGTSHITTLVPRTKEYYERLVGKHRTSKNIYDYTKQEIGEHISTLFLGEYNTALRSFLLISSHSSITLCLENFRINIIELEDLYDWLINFGDPFSCVAGIELGLSILHKYPSLELRLEKLINKLLDNAIKKEYQLLTSLIKLVDGELARLQIFRDKPAFYRRLASMAQASLITRCAIETHVIFDDLIEWADSQRNLIFYCQSFIDLRLEPRWLPNYLTAEILQAELLGRIFNVSQQYASSIISENLKNLLLNDVEGSVIRKIGVNSLLPGPLEGNIKPIDLPSDISNIIVKSLAEGVSTPESFAALINSVHYWSVEPRFTELALKVLSDAKHQLSQAKSHTQLLFTLNGLAKLSSIVKNKDLAMSLTILARKYREFLNVNSVAENLMVIGLISAASFEDIENWANYFGNWVNELSYLPLDLNAAKSLNNWVKQLCLLEPLLFCTAGLALTNLEAITSKTHS